MTRRPRLHWAQVSPEATHGWQFRSPWRSILTFRTSRLQFFSLGAAAVLTTLFLFSWSDRQRMGRVVSAALHAYTPSHEHAQWPPCRQLGGADDILIVFKTGANEVEDKLPVHLNTTFTCYPQYVIFSDLEEDLPTGHHLYDTFTYTSQTIKENHDDFELWRRLQAHGRAGLLPSELSGTDSHEKPEDVRKAIPGWQLDKWKFLPMINQTLHLHPEKHWYVFVEADTYLLWSNLIPYLAERSWEDDHYLGARTGIEYTDFAHGGSGFVLSRSALEKVATLFNENQATWEAFTEEYWVGDHILAVALNQAGVWLEESAPTWQGQPISLLEFGGEGLWCSTAMTFHHQLPWEIEDLWTFEQAWILQKLKLQRPDDVLRHRDIYEQYVLPRIKQPRAGWDNQAEESDGSTVSTLRECEAICHADVSCVQYALHDQRDCRTMSRVMLGESSEGVESGWMSERISRRLGEWERC